MAGDSENMISAREDQLPDFVPGAVEEKLAYANSTLPFLTKVVGEIDQLAREHRSIRTRLGEVDLHRHLQGNADLYSDELKAVEDSADELCDRIAECYKEMDQVEGISFDAAEPAFVDFPLQTDDGSVHFCWKLGEPKVAHWHWSNEPCESRRPLIEMESGSGKSLLA